MGTESTAGRTESTLRNMIDVDEKRLIYPPNQDITDINPH